MNTCWVDSRAGCWIWRASRACTRRYLIIDAETADVAWHAQSVQGYTEADYRSLLHVCGFAPYLIEATWDEDSDPDEFTVLLDTAV